jgi:hypothetical protein
MTISKEMKEHIGLCYVSALDIAPDIKLLSTRRLLTLLSGAANINNDEENKKLIMVSINECEVAISEYAENEDNWAKACWRCNKILDKLTPMIYSGYGSINQTSGFSLQSTKNQVDNKGVDKK